MQGARPSGFAAAIEGPAIVTSTHKKRRGMPDHPNLANAIIRPRKAAALPTDPGERRSARASAGGEAVVAGTGAANRGSHGGGEQAGRQNHQARQQVAHDTQSARLPVARCLRIECVVNPLRGLTIAATLRARQAHAAAAVLLNIDGSENRVATQVDRRGGPTRCRRPNGYGGRIPRGQGRSLGRCPLGGQRGPAPLTLPASAGCAPSSDATQHLELYAHRARSARQRAPAPS